MHTFHPWVPSDVLQDTETGIYIRQERVPPETLPYRIISFQGDSLPPWKTLVSLSTGGQQRQWPVSTPNSSDFFLDPTLVYTLRASLCSQNTFNFFLLEFSNLFRYIKSLRPSYQLTHAFFSSLTTR